MRTALALVLAAASLASPSLVRAQAPAGPIAVATVATEGVDPAAAEAIDARVAARLSETVSQREVTRIGEPARIDALAACEAPACIAEALRAEGAALGVLVHLAPAEPAAEPADGEAAEEPAPDEAEGADPEAGDTTAATRLTVGLRAVDAAGAPVGTALQATIEGTDDAALAALDGPVAQLATMIPAPPPEASLLLAINVEGAEVALDGEAVGAAPLAPLEVEPGEHRVEVRAEGFRPFREVVRVKVGEAARLDVDLQPDAATRQRLLEQDEERPAAGPPFWEQWYFWAAVGGAVAIAIIGGAAAAAANSDGGGGGRNTGFPVPEIEP